MAQTIAATSPDAEATTGTTLQAVWFLAGIYYLPHYQYRGIFVGPGGREFNASYFIPFGGEYRTLQLWARP
jgi:hypothetical protein